ncbi:MAG: trypsin-like peptidase domain-containing protein [Actinobacteria bacterium]|nr:trypsin-like peptidase domain-containing protein [Actinomycetota bacterium]
MAGSRRRPRLRWGPVIAVVVAAVLGGVVGGLIVEATRSHDDAGGATDAACAATPIADRDLPSVVTIKVAGAGGQGTGSGSIIDTEGHVLTNNHVIASAASGGRVEVVFNDGETTAATIVGRDPSTDLAVLRISGSAALHPIVLAATEEVRIGAPVIALGAPLGLSNTVTSGIVSAIDRNVSVPGTGSQGTALLVDAIQTDAAINPGNSGGALVDCAGRLVGVPSAGASVPNASGHAGAGSVGIGFAIPVDLARTVADEIIATGHAEHSYLGLQATLVQAPDGSVSGLQVVAVDPTGPAARAGIEPGDVITEVAGEAVTGADQLLALTLKQRAGAQVELEIERHGATQAVTVTLEKAP